MDLILLTKLSFLQGLLPPVASYDSLKMIVFLLGLVLWKYFCSSYILEEHPTIGSRFASTTRLMRPWTETLQLWPFPLLATCIHPDLAATTVPRPDACSPHLAIPIMAAEGSTCVLARTTRS
jgi:hypothetical protein